MFFATVCIAFLGLTVAAPQQGFNYQTLPVNYQSQPITYESQPITLQHANPVAFHTQPVSYDAFHTQPISYEQVPYQVKTVQPAPRLRVQTVRPKVQVQTLNVQPVNTFRTVQTVQPQLRTVVQQAPQVHTLVQQAPQVHTLVQQAAPAYNRVQQQQHGQFGIVRQVQDVQADGTYEFAFETENGIQFQEQGRQEAVQGRSAESAGPAVQGSYSYTSPEGTPITVNYVADANGFRAEGEHIPKASPAILRALDYLRSLPPRPEDAEGQYVPDRNNN